jgi:hypothetical protein
LLSDTGFRSPRCWGGDLVSVFDEDRLIRLKTGVGAGKPRFESLGPDAGSACIEEARRRMRALAPEEFVSRGKVVYSIASR